MRTDRCGRAIGPLVRSLMPYAATIRKVVVDLNLRNLITDAEAGQATQASVLSEPSTVRDKRQWVTSLMSIKRKLEPVLKFLIWHLLSASPARIWARLMVVCRLIGLRGRSNRASFTFS